MKPDFQNVGNGDWRLRMCNAEWLTLTLIEAILVGTTGRLRPFANVR